MYVTIQNFPSPYFEQLLSWGSWFWFWIFNSVIYWIWANINEGD